jgi:hypothetical protein
LEAKNGRTDVSQMSGFIRLIGALKWWDRFFQIGPGQMGRMGQIRGVILKSFSGKKKSRRFLKHLSYLSYLSYLPFFPFILLSDGLKSRLYGTDVGTDRGTEVG